MRIRRHLSYANVTATVALFVALGGGAYAVSKVNSREIANDSIKSVDLKDRKAVRGSRREAQRAHRATDLRGDPQRREVRADSRGR